MNPHDVIRVTDTGDGWVVECKCTRVFVASTADKARTAQSEHYGLMLARAALQGEESE